MNKNVKLTYLIIYALVLIIALCTPMHSDDFYFYSLGLSLTNHLDQYRFFCGRFFIDYFSSLLLLINNHLLISMINSIALPLLLYNITTIPYYQDNKKNPKLWIISFFLLAVYWLGNPALGQTTFWLVGACNYLWPLVILSFFLKFLLRTFYITVIRLKDYLLLIPLAFFSAVNEISGLLILFVLFVFIVLTYSKALPNRLLLSFCFIAALISYIILIAAPGNYVRASSEGFAWWQEMSLSERVDFYLTKVLPNIFKGFLIIFVVIVWAIWQVKVQFIKINKWLITLFLGCFIIFCLILFISPSCLTTRSYLTGLFYLLLTLSFLVTPIFNDAKKLSRVNKIVFISFIGWFFISYLLIVNAYYIIYQQSSFRESLIIAQKQQGKEVLYIPRFHYPFVLQEGDLPSVFHNPRIANYYGVKVINQYLVDTGFDYSQLATLTCNPVPKNPYLKCIYIAKSVFENSTKFIFEFDPNVKKLDNYKTAFIMQLSTLNKKGEKEYFLSMPLVIRPLGERLLAVTDTVTSLISSGNKQVDIYIIKEDTNFLYIKLAL